MKHCKKCNETLLEINFGKNKRYDDGLHRKCKECENKESRDRYSKNENLRKNKISRAAVYQKNKYKTDESYRSKIKAKELRKYNTNEDFRKKSIKKRSESIILKYNTNTEFKFIMDLRSLIRLSFKNYSENGKLYSIEKYGLNMEKIYNSVGPRPNDGDKWDLDHIIPVSLFNHDNPEEVKLCWSEHNLRWLKSSDNRKKGDLFHLDPDKYPKELHEHWKAAYKNYLDNR